MNHHLHSWLLLSATGLFLITSSRADCSRKTGEQTNAGEAGQEGGGPQSRAPGIEPTKHFIQTTFIYRDADDSDRRYSQLVVERLQSVIRTLRDRAHLTVDNENIDCAAQNLHRCGDFPLESPFHFLVVEDSVHGAAVYSIDREHNGERAGVIEAAILDALSRHSLYPLVDFVSSDGSSKVGFLRRLPASELEEFVRENNLAKRSRKSTSTFSLHSPFELHLLNKRIVELRVPPHPLQARSLNILSGGELTELIEEGSGSSTVFVLFWTDVNSVSTHVFELWSRVSDERVQDDLVQLCSVACHQEVDTCRAFAISHDQAHVIYAFKEGRRVATQLGFGDADFYSQWIDRVVRGSPRRLDSVEELERAQAGDVGVRGKSPAVTIAKFASEDDAALTVYRRVASMLVGRYDLMYYIDDRLDGTSLSTYRPLELVENVRVKQFTGNYDYKSLLEYVTHSSLPSVLDIGRGINSEYLFRGSPGKQLLLLIHDGQRVGFRQKFYDAASQNGNKWVFAEINTKSAVDLDRVFEKLDLSEEDIPLVCLIEQAKIVCAKGLSEGGEELSAMLMDPKLMTHSVELDPRKPHPLAYIQLARINELFGHQEIEMLPEPVLTSDTNEFQNSHHHGLENLDAAAVSGCPMMAHLNNIRDEL